MAKVKQTAQGGAGATSTPDGVRERDRRSRISDAAEALFAADGFEGTTLRAIAKRADVDLALIAHHFGSKQELFHTVLARRADLVHRERLETLEECRSRWRGPPPIEDLVDAFFSPLFQRAEQQEDWHNYLKLVTRLSVDPEWTEVISGLYNITAKYFINAMRVAAPHASEDRLFWAYHFLLGGMVFTGANSGRIENISGSQIDTSELATVYPHLVRFVSAGIKAVLEIDKI